jgi:hypothetical protein
MMLSSTACRAPFEMCPCAAGEALCHIRQNRRPSSLTISNSTRLTDDLSNGRLLGGILADLVPRIRDLDDAKLTEEANGL